MFRRQSLTRRHSLTARDSESSLSPPPPGLLTDSENESRTNQQRRPTAQVRKRTRRVIGNLQLLSRNYVQHQFTNMYS